MAKCEWLGDAAPLHPRATSAHGVRGGIVRFRRRVMTQAARMLMACLLAWMVVLPAACSKHSQGKPGGGDAAPAEATPASPGERSGGGNGNGSQSSEGSGSAGGTAPATAAPAGSTPPGGESGSAAAGNPEGAPATARRPAGTPKAPVRVATIGKRPARLVNLAEATRNPKIVVVENKVNPADPLGSVVTRYFDAAARVSTLGLQQAVKAHHALNGRYPTFEEFQRMIQQHRVKLAPLPPYQMYAYDEKTGGIVIVEDKAEKIRLYEQNGIPLDPGDEKYR